jgi:hypothetical protein
LHRIESSTVRREVEAAGFKFDAESSVLAIPADPRTGEVFDQTIRGKTDQFILKFRKTQTVNVHAHGSLSGQSALQRVSAAANRARFVSARN